MIYFDAADLANSRPKTTAESRFTSRETCDLLSIMVFSTATDEASSIVNIVCVQNGN